MFDAVMASEALRWIKATIRHDEELQAIALVMVWYYWSLKPDVPVRQHAYYASRQVLEGRDLPGVRTGKTRDAYRLRKVVEGGTMQNLPDRKPGPVRIVSQKEQFAKLCDAMTEREQAIADAFLDGLANNEVAQRFGVSPARMTQIRQAMMRHLEG